MGDFAALAHGEPVCPENDILWCELYIDFITLLHTHVL